MRMDQEVVDLVGKNQLFELDSSLPQRLDEVDALSISPRLRVLSATT